MCRGGIGNTWWKKKNENLRLNLMGYDIHPGAVNKKCIIFYSP